jgi:hypothetical protein
VGVERKVGGRVLLQGDVRAGVAVSKWARGGWPFTCRGITGLDCEIRQHIGGQN